MIQQHAGTWFCSPATAGAWAHGPTHLSWLTATGGPHYDRQRQSTKKAPL